MSQCIDKFVGEVLAGWRYDISGLAPEMRGDYEDHLRLCTRCRSKQRLHRWIDVSLLFLASVSSLVFLLAFGAIRHFSPARALILEIVALGGFAVSALVWVIVAVATPLPVMVFGVAKSQARKLQERLPPEIRNRIPENLSSKINS